MTLRAHCLVRERPDRSPARSSSDQHDRTVAVAQESLSERAANLDAMAGPDCGTDLGRDDPPWIAADVEYQFGAPERSIPTDRRAQVPCREHGKLHAEILPGAILDRGRERHHELDHIGRKPRYFPDGASALDNLRHFVEGDLGVAGHKRLASEH